MKQIFALIILTLAFAPATVRAQDGHEYAPIEEKAVNYKSWIYKNLADGKLVDLRSLVQDKKLVMVVYFAPWCPNWKNEAPIAASLNEKYKSQGFEVIGISEYSSRDEVRAFFGPSGPPYTVVTESESRDDRQKTPHYGYRQLTGDTRKWGSPWNIFLEPPKLSFCADVVTEKAWVVNGELIEGDANKFIGEHLGASSAAIIPCKQ